MLAVTLGAGSAAQILVVGAGGGAFEIVAAGSLESKWRFTAVDPSQPMMDISIRRLEGAGLIERTELHLGYVDDLPLERRFDAATLIGVLHHQPGDGAKRALLGSLAARLKPGAPLILARNRYAYASRPPSAGGLGRALAHARGERRGGQGEAREDPAGRRSTALG